MWSQISTKLKSLSPRQQNLVLILAMVVTAAIIIPAWLWNIKNWNFKTQSTGNATSTSASLDISTIVDQNNPISQVDQGLQESLTNPVAISKAEVANGELQIKFAVNNSSLTDLTFPTELSSIFQNNEQIAVVKRAAQADGTAFPATVPSGQSLSGIMYFPKVANGKYQLKLSNLLYSGDNQTPFEQTLDFQVTNVLLPRQ